MVRLHRTVGSEDLRGGPTGFAWRLPTARYTRVDLEGLLQAGGVCAPIRDERDVFAAVSVDRELGTIVWPGTSIWTPTCAAATAAGVGTTAAAPSRPAGLTALSESRKSNGDRNETPLTHKVRYPHSARHHDARRGSVTPKVRYLWWNGRAALLITVIAGDALSLRMGRVTPIAIAALSAIALTAGY
jgi:hypothetical protein